MWAAIRLIRATWVFAWIFASYLLQLGLQRLFGRVRVRARWARVHRRNARRMYRGFVKLRGVYIKLGQILSIMGTFLPRAYGEELEGLQDEVPPRSYKTIAASFKRAFGKPPEEAFATFAHKPIAAASLAQVHEATGRNGERFAVKLLYPNVSTIIKVDLRVLDWALRVYRWFVPVQQLERVHEQLEDLLARETNLQHEARCLERMAANFDDDPEVLFPAVNHEYTGETVLTMSFMEGVKITRASELDQLALASRPVAIKLVQVFFKQLLIDRFFHADPHPGNFFVQRGPEGQPRLVILDFGSASEVSEHLADGMLDILSGLMSRNDELVIRGIETMGFVAEGGDRKLLERTTRKYFEKLLNLQIPDLGTVSKLSMDVANRAVTEVNRAELRELMKSVQYPAGWFYIERAVVIMFGLATQLDPDLDVLTIGLPYVVKFVSEQQSARQATQAATSAATNDAPPATAAATKDVQKEPQDTDSESAVS